mgnify:FL=1|jgi:hypothetical protein
MMLLPFRTALVDSACERGPVLSAPTGNGRFEGTSHKQTDNYSSESISQLQLDLL